MPHKRRVVFYIVERGRIRGDDGVPAPNHQRSPKGPDDPGFGDISQLYLADYPAMSLIFGNKKLAVVRTTDWSKQDVSSYT